jgi:8-amino-7-oxononanoate synthase
VPFADWRVPISAINDGTRHVPTSMTPMPVAESAPGAYTRIDGREYLYFVGTGYLGLQGHPEVIRAACEATQQYGIHSATTRAGFGNTPPTLSAEQSAAEFFATEDAFYFVSGYAGNSILLSALENDFDALFVDELSHYCVFEAARHRRCPSFTFRHRNVDDLAAVLTKNLQPDQRPLVLSDGVFSARGTIAPVDDYCKLLKGYEGAGLLLDDAHAIAVLGTNGRGTLEHFGFFDGRTNTANPVGNALRGVPQAPANASNLCAGTAQRPFPTDAVVRVPDSASKTGKDEYNGCATFICGTLSKAIGAYGGIIPGSREFLGRVRNASHWYDGASSPPAAAGAATVKALELIRADASHRTRLWSNVRMLKDGLRAMGFDVDDTPVPIICLIAGNADNMRRIQHELMVRGIAIAYMAAYAGLGPEGGLRIAVFATHTEAMIRQLLDQLRQLV